MILYVKPIKIRKYYLFHIDKTSLSKNFADSTDPAPGFFYRQRQLLLPTGIFFIRMQTLLLQIADRLFVYRTASSAYMTFVTQVT